MATIADDLARLEQWITDVEVAITAQDALIWDMIRKGDGVYQPTQSLKSLHSRLAYLHTRRRMLLRSQAFTDVGGAP
jgi:hypothetical protein